MQSNVIILTPGLCGSSVLAGLISQAGFWLGDSTFKKPDYDTYENQELVDLNQRLFDEVGHRENLMVCREEDVRSLMQASQSIDLDPYRRFVDRCNENQPWLWKDPRLWLTIRFWGQFLDFSRVRFIYLSRESQQQWISSTLRRHIQTREFSDRTVAAVHRVVTRYLKEKDQPWLELIFEDIFLDPENTLQRLNEFIGTSLTIDDLQRVYRMPLYRKQRGFRDLITANLIYFKNYGQRYR